MSHFAVKPSALDTYAGVLGVGGHAVNLERAFSGTALGYVNSYVPVPADDGDLFYEVYVANREVVSHLQGLLPRIGTLYAASAAALESAAQAYRTTDTEAARAADAAYGQRSGVSGLHDVPSGSSGLVDPTPQLHGVPSKDAPIPDMVHWVIDKAGWLSIAGTVLKIAQLFGLDPVKELNEAVLGDYSELAQAGHALEALAAFERQAASTMSAGLSTMGGEWTGNAATAATSYFEEFAGALHGHAGELDTLGEKYALLVQACTQVAELLGSALANAIDQLLICAAKLAAAGCLSTVPGINVIAGLVGAYQVWVTKDAVALFIKYTSRVTTVVESFLGLTVYIASAFKDGSLEAAFPPAPYANGATS
ncbi:MAG: WXG100 family type VII secretion target [Nocardioides sp.]